MAMNITITLQYLRGQWTKDVTALRSAVSNNPTIEFIEKEVESLVSKLENLTKANLPAVEADLKKAEVTVVNVAKIVATDVKAEVSKAVKAVENFVKPKPAATPVAQILTPTPAPATPAAPIAPAAPVAPEVAATPATTDTAASS